MRRSELTLKRLLIHNTTLLLCIFGLVFLVAYSVIVLRSVSYFFILKFQLVSISLAIAIGLLYMLFIIFQLYLDGKKKRKIFFKEPLRSLTNEGFHIGFSKLAEWNYASSWCLQKYDEDIYGELDVDRIASEQKNYIQFRVKPPGYKRKNYQSTEMKNKLESLDGEADKKCLVFFIEEREVKKMTSEKTVEWITERMKISHSSI